MKKPQPRRLLLIRHAKSSWADDTLADIDRPLNARGHRDGPLMARFAADHLAPPERVLCSPSLRTRTTARYLVEAGFIQADTLSIEPRLYLAEADELLAIVRETSASVHALALIGHNPGLTELANRLAPEESIDNIPTLGIVEIALAIDDWPAAGPARGRRTAFYTPKSIRNSEPQPRAP